ncbi:MAG: hypothetical protein HY438_03990 [DPANN group archaeon]|nr:hypothetical protein [DPANN group archaeon]
MANKRKPFAYQSDGSINVVVQTLPELINELRASTKPEQVSICCWFPGAKNSTGLNSDIYSQSTVVEPPTDTALAEVEKARESLEDKIVQLKEEIEKGETTFNATELFDKILSDLPKWYALGLPTDTLVKKYIEAHKYETRVWLPMKEIEANLRKKGWA